MNAFPMRLAAEVMLNRFKTIILVHVVNHPSKLVNIFALVARIVCNNVQVLVSWLRWNDTTVFLVKKLPDKGTG